MKPDEVRHAIEKMFPKHERIELFARRAFRGWSAWGLEVLDEDPNGFTLTAP
jgi:N6-adenosine-specific RNA methylase IME4